MWLPSVAAAPDALGSAGFDARGGHDRRRAFGYLAADQTQPPPAARPGPVEGSGPAASTASSAPLANCPAAALCPEKPCPACAPAKPCPATIPSPPIASGPTPREQELAEGLKRQDQELKQCIDERAKRERTANAQKEKLDAVQKALDACQQKPTAATGMDSKLINGTSATTTPVLVRGIAGSSSR